MRRFAPLPTAFALLLTGLAPAAAETASLLADLNPGRQSAPGDSASSGPGGAAVAGARLVFTAFEPSSGTEVWGSDGTASGTEMLADSCPGACETFPTVLGSAGSAAFFLAAGGDGFLLWRTDGTRAGTRTVTAAGSPLAVTGEGRDEDVWPAALLGGALYVRACGAPGCGLWRVDGAGGEPRLLRAEGEDERVLAPRSSARTLFFFLRTSDGTALWKSDGTAAGTAEVREVVEPRFATAAGDRLFFAAEAAAGTEVWASDGTTAGTRALTDFAPADPFDDAQSSIELPDSFKAAGGSVYFFANDVVHGWELWTSDGTPAGTHRTTDFGFFRPFGSAPRLAQVAPLGARVLFVASDGLTPPRLWTTDGRPESTARLADLAPQELVAVGTRALFVAGTEVWGSDGTAAGTAALGHLGHGLAAVGGAGYFVAAKTLWRTNGTPAGTRRVTDGSGDPQAVLAAIAGQVFFAGSETYGRELWVADGRRNTRLLANIARPAAAGSDPRAFIPLGTSLLLTVRGDAGQGRSLWTTDGTPAGSRALTSGCCAWQGLAAVGGVGYFLAASSEFTPATALWRTDGTAAGTFPLLERPYGSEIDPRAAVLGGRLFVRVVSGGDHAFWSTDGTVAGTVRAVPIVGDYFRALDQVGGELYFATFVDDAYVVWRSDGTPAGTVHAAELPDHNNEPLAAAGFTRAGAAVFFLSQDDDTYGWELWKTDGTVAGASRLASLAVNFDDGVVRDHFVALGNALLLLVRVFDADPDREVWDLWRSDGTAAGTTRLVRFAGGPAQEQVPLGLVALGGRVFFAADDGVHGRELWASDGTAAGTVLVRDVYPGPTGSGASGLTVAGGKLFFTAADPVHGVELWQSDGTAAGTRLVQDIAPEGASSSPRELTAAGDRLYFSADDGLHGREPWVLPLAASAGCRPAADALCLGGRFRVEVEWRDFKGNTGRGQAAPLTADTGTFWFFDPSNVELVVKVLDGRSLNDHFWVFYGALSSVEYTLTVTDTQTGLTRRYFNPAGRLASTGDTHGFGPLGAFSRSSGTGEPAVPATPVSQRTDPAAATGFCQPAPGRLCLGGGRFALEAAWKDFQGHTGSGHAVPLTADTGYLWFFNADNVEVVVKVLDGRPVNGKFWLFYGALSNVEYTLTVTDTQTGAVRMYSNPSGRFASVADTGAF